MIAWDEMWPCRGARRGEKREGCWIRTAAAPEADGRRWVDFEAGDRSEAPSLRLYERLPDAVLYRSDAYPVYRAWPPPERHTAGRDRPVNRNEVRHSVWRGKLNRLMRQTKGYSKSAAMLAGSVALGLLARHCKVSSASVPPYVQNTLYLLTFSLKQLEFVGDARYDYTDNAAAGELEEKRGKVCGCLMGQ